MATQILLADDSPVDRTLFGGLLSAEPDYHVTFANNGRAAWEAVKDSQFDVVVTDMHMPEMDGLELVRSVRSTYPELPIILLTGKGTEELANVALKSGASGFVAKPLAAEMLTKTVGHILTLAADSNSVEPIRAIHGNDEVRLQLPNDPDLVSDVTRLAQKMARRIGIDDPTEVLRIATAVEEAMHNAIFHGNLELPHMPQTEAEMETARKIAREIPFRNRFIEVRITASGDQLRIVIADCGGGFDVAENARMAKSLSGDQSGRGLFLMRAFMDRVVFSHAGNRVTLVKFKKQVRKNGLAKLQAEPESTAH